MRSIMIALAIGLSINVSISRGQTVTINMGQAYTNDVYFSFENGIVDTEARANWDIAFYTASFSAGIITNDGSEVVLYTYPNGDTAAWSSLDTNGMSGWKALYNDPTDWENGAFNRNETGHPDYGWGTYNIVTHNVTGDSLYVIRKTDGTYAKLWIKRKQSAANIYEFMYADLDGSNEEAVSLDVSGYTDKNFIYYSLVNNLAIDREPDAAWDVVFTKYMEIIFDNDLNEVPYPVTGILSNISLSGNKFYPVDPAFESWPDKEMEYSRNLVGYDFKDFDMTLFEWAVKDSMICFLMPESGDIYRLSFLSWEGSATGISEINTQMVSALGLEEDGMFSNLQIFPNPSHGLVHIRNVGETAEATTINIMDMQGRLIQTYQTVDPNGLILDLENLNAGMYFLHIQQANQTLSKRIIIQ